MTEPKKAEPVSSCPWRQEQKTWLLWASPHSFAGAGALEREPEHVGGAFAAFKIPDG